MNLTPVPGATMPDAAAPLLALVEAAEYEFASIWRQAQRAWRRKPLSVLLVLGPSPRIGSLLDHPENLLLMQPSTSLLTTRKTFYSGSGALRWFPSLTTQC